MDPNSNEPTLDCLAIAQEFYCAYSFPYCTDTEPNRGVCNFLCDLWKNRCPAEPYDLYCGNNESTKCSNAADYLVGMLILFTLN